MKKLVLIALVMLSLSSSLSAMEDSKSMLWSEIVSKTKNNDVFLTRLIKANTEALRWRVIPTIKCLKPESESAKPAVYVFFEKVFNALDFKEKKEQNKNQKLQEKLAVIADKLNELAYAFTEETKALFVSYFNSKPHLLTIREIGKLKSICNPQKTDEICVNFIHSMPHVLPLEPLQQRADLRCDLANIGISWGLLIRDGLLTQDGSTPLHEAIRKKNIDLIKSLLKNKALINAQDKDGHTPLFIAAQSGLSDIVQLLLDAGVEVNAQNCEGSTPLASAAVYGFGSPSGNVPVMEMLWKYGASIQSKHVLAYAATCNPHAVKFLLEKGAEVNERSAHVRWTALHYAAIMGNVGTSGLLLKAGAAPDIQAIDGETPLSYAWSPPFSEGRHLTVVRMLLDAGASKNIKGQHNSLHWASFIGDIELVKHLLSAGHNINDTDKYGFKPIHYGAKGGHVALMQLLLEGGADKDALTKDELTPLSLAVEYPEVVRLLLTAGAKVEKQIITRWLWTCCARANNNGMPEKIESYKKSAQILGLEEGLPFS